MHQICEEPEVSICIACYNAEDTIERAVKSAVKQSFKQLEILVCDDFSSDQSKVVLGRLAKQHPKIKLLFHKENGGPAATRNSLVGFAKGKYVAFFDDDDASFPDRIETQLYKMKEIERVHPHKPVCCFASGRRFYPNGYEISLMSIGAFGHPLIGTEVADYLLFNSRVKGKFYGTGTPSCSMMVRKETLTSVGGFDENLRRVEDADLAIRLALRGAIFAGCKKQLFAQYSTSGDDKSPLKNYESEILITEKHRCYLSSKRAYFYARCWKKIRYAYFSKNYLELFWNGIILFFIHPIRFTTHLKRSALNRLKHDININRKY